MPGKTSWCRVGITVGGGDEEEEEVRQRPVAEGGVNGGGLSAPAVCGEQSGQQAGGEERGFCLRKHQNRHFFLFCTVFLYDNTIHRNRELRRQQNIQFVLVIYIIYTFSNLKPSQTSFLSP